jgi:hypothetical protein
MMNSILEISLYYPSFLSMFLPFFSSLPPLKQYRSENASSSGLTIESAEDVIQIVYKRLRSLRKRIERCNQIVLKLQNGPISYEECIQMEQRLIFVVGGHVLE